MESTEDTKATGVAVSFKDGLYFLTEEGVTIVTSVPIPMHAPPPPPPMASLWQVLSRPIELRPELLPKMVPDVKARFIEALTSGLYRQCWGQFRVSNAQGVRFCAVGLLLHILGCEGMDELTEAFKLSGLSPKSSHALYNLNDGGMTFPRIAEWVAAYL